MPATIFFNGELLCIVDEDFDALDDGQAAETKGVLLSGCKSTLILNGFDSKSWKLIPRTGELHSIQVEGAPPIALGREDHQETREINQRRYP